MFKEAEFNEFTQMMEQEIMQHDAVYGDSWKKEPVQFIEQRLNAKINEYNLTKNPKKMASVANLAMILWAKYKRENRG
jgi:hypothetical protein